jgi:HAD superfamily hydrolase (TIGR01549 family)
VSIRVVVFDVGETLIEERRVWHGWADYLGVPAHEFLAAFQDVIANGEDHRRVFDRFRPGFDIAAARRERALQGESDLFGAQDLYPDAAPCLRELRRRDFKIGIAGNQPDGAVEALKALDLAADILVSSASLGVSKPAPEFFAKLVEIARVPASAIAYVGDRLDNDVLPARAAGMKTVFLLRGPWASVQAKKPEAKLADVTLDNLLDLPDALETPNNRRKR